MKREIEEMLETNLFVVAVKQPCAGGFLYLSIHQLAEQKGIRRNEEIEREMERERERERERRKSCFPQSNPFQRLKM